jgi:phthalate 4,5-dioxygenase oxygenase subunit
VLSHEENELITRTGPGTPMGELFRRFWVPALLPSELPNPDCPPVRLRLFSEDLVAFRDSNGRVGVLDAHCAHRGASLFFGRNEECGLRCVYHGWKYDVSGRCVDMPNEPELFAGDLAVGEANATASPLAAATRRFRDKIHLKAYPAREWGGLIWVYMGPADQTPELPQLEWALVPGDQRRIGKWIQDVNYLQCLEGEIDTSHVSFLHSSLQPSAVPNKTTRPELLARDRSPKLIVKNTDYGFLYGARRTAGDGQYYWRVTQWLMPTYSLIPSAHYPGGGRVWVPIDDEHTMAFTYSYHPDRPLADEERSGFASGRGFPPELIPGTFSPKRNQENDYLIDREEQRTRTFTGIYGINDQDRSMLDGMGSIVDRRKEHLGTTDTAIIVARRRLLEALRNLQRGIEPAAAHRGDLYRVRALDVVAPQDGLDALMEAQAAALTART